jgi:hypothetical protein
MAGPDSLNNPRYIPSRQSLRAPESPRVQRQHMKIEQVVTATLLSLVVYFMALDASAAPTNEQANLQIDNAINTHYASADINLAEKKLLEVVKACTGSCAPAVIARAWMYVGIVRGSGRDDIPGAQEAFKAAKAADPTIKLDDLFATDLVKKAFDQTPGPTGADGMPLMGDMRERAGQAPATTSTICSLDVSEVETQRPIPVSCRTVAGAQSAVLSYRHESSTRWHELPMKKDGSNWVAEIPCTDTTQIGVLAYHVRALDPRGQPLDSLGTADEPQELNLVQTTDAAPPALPGQAPPASCRPKKKPEPKGPKLGSYGDACSDGSQCQGGLTCTDGKCAADVSCDSDAECLSGICIDSVCTIPDDEDAAGQSRVPGNWFGLQGGLDFAMMSGSQVCGDDADVAFSCFEGSDPYVGVPNFNYSGNIEGGFRPATARVMLSYERVISSLFSVEGRLGFAFNGGPESPRSIGGDNSKFLPFHAEGRVKAYFTKVYRDDGSGLRGPSGFAMLGGGLAQVDPKVSVPVGECRIDDGTPAGAQRIISQLEDQCRRSENQVFDVKDVDVYQRLGTAFVTGGVGFRYGFGKQVAAIASVNAQFLLPSAGFTLSPSLGIAAGF